MKYRLDGIDRVSESGAAAEGIDAGLRAYMNMVYLLMSFGLAVSAIFAWAVFSMPALGDLFYVIEGDGVPVDMSILGWMVVASPFLIIPVMSFGSGSMGAGTLKALFLLLSALMGISLASVFMLYELRSIISVFGLSSVSFLALSLYGYTTRRDLSGMHSFLFMGLIGIIVALIVNMVLFQSAAMDFVISVIGVLVFAGWTAYDTQKIKRLYYEGPANQETTQKKAVFGALSLYLDLVNLFLFLLRLLGERK